MNIPKMSPVKVPSMPKPIPMARPAGTPMFDRAPEVSGEQRPLARFRAMKLDQANHWTGK